MSTKELFVVSPVDGKAVLLEQVPDSVFSEKILGDGIAVIPENGRYVCPVDGEVVSVAESLHAIGFRTEDGIELLMHIGLDTVKLDGKGFTVHVKEGDKVKKGAPAVDVDLQILEENNLSSITPIVVCDGADDLNIMQIEGSTKAVAAYVTYMLWEYPQGVQLYKDY